MAMNGLDLISAENPLLVPLGEWVGELDWPEKLAVDPLAGGFDRQALNGMQRDLMLSLIRSVFEPTKPGISIASTVQSMIWRHYVYDNPTLPQNRARLMRILGRRGESIVETCWLPRFADAFMVMGCTGTGKTTIIERILTRIPQVYEHSRSVTAGWESHLQITYLIVKMSPHKGGLLYEILAAIDRAIGTNLREKYSSGRKWTVQNLATEVAILLVQYSVGILVIEEIQARNFSASPNREEMLLFILYLLNIGIPVVLVGNPLGFIGLEDFGQDINRLTENEPMHLMPSEQEDVDWEDGIGPRIWGHNTMRQDTPWDKTISTELFNCSAAFPGFARKATEWVQKYAWAQPGRLAVGATDLVAYRQQSDIYKMNQDLIQGFAQKDPFRLMRYLDVPWEEYGLKWGKLTLEDIADAEVGDTAVDGKLDEEGKTAYRSVHAMLRQAAAGQLTRKANKARSAKAAKAAAQTDDLRSGTIVHLAAGLDALKKSSLAKNQGTTGSR